jgi:hypothetical protein
MCLHRTFACSVVLLALAPTAARACSMSGVTTTQWPGRAHLIATVKPDTVAAGPGSADYVVSQGHFGPARERPIYGQVVEVERVGGMGAKGLGPSFRRVVLVPWDYGANCTPTPWTGSARWLEPGTRGLFTATLRDRAHWAGGLPTFDVRSPDSVPYPQRRGREGFSVPADSLMSVEDYFSLLEMLPAPDRVESSAADAYRPLFRWAERQPELARRFPASQILSYARYDVDYERLRGIAQPLAGTYRFEVRLGEGAPRVFYARTRTRASSWWHVGPPGPDNVTAGNEGGAGGYHMLASGSASPGSLPTDTGPTRRMEREGYMAVLREPEPGAGGRTWRGRIGAELVARQFPADSALQRFTGDWLTRARRGDPQEAPARFVLAPDGTVRVTQTVRLQDGRTLQLSGTRISRETIVEPQ